MSGISFIIPTFNRARYLGDALSAIVGQMNQHDELLVIDDGSTDGTANVVRSLAPVARYVWQANAGKAAALNRALASTFCEFIWICDDDDILRPGVVELLRGALAASDVGFVFGRYSRFRDLPDGTKEDLGTGYWPKLDRGSLVRHVLDDAFVMQNAALVRRSAYAAVGPFSEALPRSLDYEMFVRLVVSHTARYVDHIIFDQRKHDGLRGPAAQLHAAADASVVWQKYDQLIFRNLYAHLPLHFFEGFFVGGTAGSRQRAARLLRGSIMGRHGCWVEAFEDFAAAAQLCAMPLAQAEIDACRSALSGKHAFPDLVRLPGLRPRFRALGSNKTGLMIRREIIRGGLWRLRHDFQGTGRQMASLIRKSGCWGDVVRLWGRRRAVSAFAADPMLRELHHLDGERLVAPGMPPPVKEMC